MFSFKKIKYLYIILTILLLIISLYAFNIQNISLNIEIKKGDNISKVKKYLCEKENFLKCFLTSIYIYFHKPNKIIPGKYIFSGNSIKEIIKQLEKGPPIKYIRFTIFPGETKFDIADHISKYSQKNKETFLKLTTDKSFILKIKNNFTGLEIFGNLNSLEGFLYPDTYFFKKEDLETKSFPELLIKTSIKNFIKKIKNINWQNNYNLNPYEILIIASIVEKEEFNNKNKPIVANILIKRYKNNWKIGADWTLCYGLKVTSNNCKKFLFSKYLSDKSNIYNTRANNGLPPTPVSNPTINTIKCVINSSPTAYWYYLHDNKGNIHFSKTANEHNINKYKYLK